MNFIKRALLYSRAKWARTLLMIATFAAVLVFVLAGITINTGAKQSIESAKKEAGASVTLSVNRENMRPSQGEGQTGFSMPTIALSDAEAVAKLPDIKSYSFTKQTTAIATSGITPIESESSETADDAQATPSAPSGGRMAGGMMADQGDFRVIGTNDLKANTDFANGTNKLVKGRLLTDKDESSQSVVIEESLAKANDLSVGDSFTITANDTDYELTVVGIYSSTTSLDGMAAQFSFMNVSNQLYVGLSTAATMSGKTDTVDSAIYNLKDPKDSSSFVKAAEKAVDSTDYQITSNDTLYQQMLSPLNNVSKIAKNIVVLVTIAGVIILSLIVMLSIRERRSEIGILMSMGESRLKVIGQFFVELLLVMVVAMGIATASGSVVGNMVGQQLLSNQTTTTTNQSNTKQTGMPEMPTGGERKEMRGNPFSPNKVEAKAINKLKIRLTSQQIILLGAIALGIAILASIIASIGILRLSPKAILTF